LFDYHLASCGHQNPKRKLKTIWRSSQAETPTIKMPSDGPKQQQHSFRMWASQFKPRQLKAAELPLRRLANPSTPSSCRLSFTERLLGTSVPFVNNPDLESRHWLRSHAHAKLYTNCLRISFKRMPESLKTTTNSGNSCSASESGRFVRVLYGPYCSTGIAKWKTVSR